MGSTPTATTTMLATIVGFLNTIATVVLAPIVLIILFSGDSAVLSRTKIAGLLTVLIVYAVLVTTQCRYFKC